MTPHLKRELTLFDLVFYGVGIIFGAGIYVLIGHAAGIAGSGVWLSFVVAAFVAIFTGLSYAELSSMYPRDAAEYIFVKRAFNDTTTGFIIGWLTFFAAVIGSAVVALGFGNYFQKFTGLNPIIGAIMLLLVLAFVNYRGIRASSRMNIILTSITVLGLLTIIAIGAPYIGSIDYFEFPNGFDGVIGAATLVFFAYLGFDEIVNVAEEAKNARKNVPKAIMISIAITTTIYILVALAAVSVVPWQELGQSGTPLALVASTALGSSADFVMSLFGLFATASTTLIFLVAGSRMLYGMAEDHALSKVLLKIDKKTNTPYVAILVITAISIFFVFFGNIKDIALLVDFSAFLIFAMMNLCAFIFRFSQPNTPRGFRIPLTIGRAPILPLLGFLISLYMLLQFEMKTAWIAVIIMVIGYLYYKFNEASKSEKLAH